MIKDNNLSFENYVQCQSPSRKRALKTKSSYKQNHLIRQHIADWLMHQFGWDYWVTFTFGYNPDLSEVQDILHKTHHRIDQRILKHTTGMSVMQPDQRSKWILFPEYAKRGLHYHGFIQLNTNPNLRTSYPSEWWWLDAALRDTTRKMEHLLSNGGAIHYKHYERGWRTKDQLQMILYSMKEYGKGASHYDQDPAQDRFSHTIVSWVDWKVAPLWKHGRNKLDDIPPRPDKIFDQSLESFFT